MSLHQRRKSYELQMQICMFSEIFMLSNLSCDVNPTIWNFFAVSFVFQVTGYFNNIISPSSPSGKLMQIEYALQAVSSGAASVGLKASNGVVLATEKKTKSILYEEHSTHKIEMITDSIGAVYSGMGPDYRQLIRRARKMAHQYKLVYGEPITTSEMVKRLATVMQVMF